MFFNKIIIVCLFSLFYVLPVYSNSPEEGDIKKTNNYTDAVGSLGRIEPKSRVVRVSHNAGAEGVNLLRLFVQEGSMVKQGDELALLADHDKKQADLGAGEADIVALKAKLFSERVNQDFLEREYHRYESLANKSLASQSLVDSKSLEYKRSQAKIKELQAEVSNAEANVKVLREEVKNTVIVAPISGTILKIHAWPGERLDDDGLLEMADLSQLDIVAEVYESDLPKVKVSQNAEIHVVGINKIYTATVREIGFLVRKNDQNDTDPLADRDNRVIEVRLTLDNRAISDLQHQIYRQVKVRIKL